MSFLFSNTKPTPQRPAATNGTDAAGPDVEGLPADARRQRIGDELNHVVACWTERIGELGLEAKGLWLVDFDNGSGYYCWRYPEDAVSHFHDYDGGFAGRMRIV